jgi:hypothetical protein
MGLNSYDLSFENCDSPEKLQKLREFAATFEPPHEILDTKNRIVIVKRNGQWIGYAEIVETPVVFSAWSKKHCQPRDILEAMKAFTGWAKIQFGQGLTAVPLDTRTFPEKVMNKLGLYRIKAELYTTNTKE